MIVSKGLPGDLGFEGSRGAPGTSERGKISLSLDKFFLKH